ncbi:MAG TPA: amidophosphoribosyltransferase, partial [Saprospiraceae bacterium]|nr:amidophosphoribosyltransferase [Saprospiraceae bacterium]
EPFTDEEISARIAKLVTADGIIPQVDVIFQTVESLHVACPNDKGDWYFTGDYPTLGGVRVVNRAFINYIEDVKERSY